MQIVITKWNVHAYVFTRALPLSTLRQFRLQDIYRLLTDTGRTVPVRMIELKKLLTSAV